METTMTLSPMAATKSKSTPSPWSKDFLERHNLLGYAFGRTQDKIYYPYWKNQLNRNSVAKEELETIGKDLQKDNVQVFLLKGFSIMGELYKDWGERYVSDIDLLVSHDELWKLTDILKMYGYRKRKQERWLANRHKHVFVKKNAGVPIAIEVHTQLFWHTQLKLSETVTPSAVEGFAQLSTENQLIHLCGHIGFQHGYSKLFWLLDIFKYVERHHKKINWTIFWDNARKARLYKSCYFTLFLCQKMGLNLQPMFFRAPRIKTWSIALLKKLVSFSYLYNPDRKPVRSFVIRFLMKDAWFDNLRYSWAWLKTFRS